MNEKFSGSTRLYSLDAVKLFATVLILFHHYQQYLFIKFDTGINFFGGKFYFGRLVELFFILSGFFMGVKIKENMNISFKNFISRKLIRLYPMCIISTACYIVITMAYKFFYGDWIYKSIPIDWKYGIWDAFCALMNFRGGGTT